ncbi:OLC1v1006291C1 [Oldenlandia corymbosa var. corymbosa]|uniref:OLC1v1006291C1 n=1 Tax=Oldenlandia corymbosa var. corymbosa TaxID=529605 RepID=A0AAV1DGN0_OLDCO|nr:OLC1v1006291C1 [Oldenlandia corymbosa var. corymbosa]
MGAVIIATTTTSSSLLELSRLNKSVNVNSLRLDLRHQPRFLIPVLSRTQSSSSFSSLTPFCNPLCFNLKLSSSRRAAAAAALPMFSDTPIVADVVATALTGGIALSLLQFWGEIAKMGLLDQKLSRKLVHISVGLVFMLCWPMFRPGYHGAILAALVPGINIIKMLVLGLGLWKDEATVKSMTRLGDHRELLKGPLYYATTITLACAIYWRTSPIAVAAVCNLCAGDGMADIIGRRFGHVKLPYNINKSVAGSLSMAVAGLLASIGFMHYFSLFGYVEESWEMVYKFFIISVSAALVESLPISTELDDNLTVPLASLVVGTILF